VGATLRHLRGVCALLAATREETGGRTIKRLIYSLAGVGLLGVAGFFIYQALSSSLVYFITPSEYAAEPERYAGHIRLGGLVEANSVNYNADTSELSFKVWDGYAASDVLYSGAPPELFKENTGVVVVGQFEDSTFVSDELLVKHTEVYRPAEGEKVSIEELKDALQ